MQLTMDLYRPEKAATPHPAVVYIHGGGWTSGDKSDGTGLLFREELTRRGYIFASINYRLAPKYSFPAPIEDAKCAVRYLRANAAQFNLDPERIGVLGGSAGGQLAALLGAADEEKGWDVGEFPDQSSQVQAVVDMFGPSDLPLMFAKSERPIFLEIFGATNGSDPILKKFSPVTYIDPGDPPFLLLHGEKDDAVPLEQSQVLYQALIHAGVPVELIVVKNAGHSFVQMGKEINPGVDEISHKVADFFDLHLK